jgi:hypothetical protein
MNMKRSSLLVTVLTGALALGACGDDGTGTRLSQLNIRLTDAPGDLVEARVQVTQIILQGVGGSTSLLDDATAFVDLLTLSGGATADLVTETVSAGTYAQLRFVIEEACIETDEGEIFATSDAAANECGGARTGTLACPSCEQTGIKVNLPGGAVALDDDAEILVVDFDVSQSFGRAAGTSGQWVMHPTLTATNVEFSGTIAGTVTLDDGVTIPECGGAARDLTTFIPTATSGEMVKSGVTETDGSYSIAFVSDGTWTLGVSETVFDGEKLVFTATPSVNTVDVQSGATATANFAVSAVACETI